MSDFFTCPDCGDIFPTIEDLESHISECNYDEPFLLTDVISNPDITCNSCNLLNNYSSHSLMNVYGKLFHKTPIFYRIIFNHLFSSPDIIVKSLFKTKENSIECPECKCNIPDYGILKVLYIFFSIIYYVVLKDYIGNTKYSKIMINF